MASKPLNAKAYGSIGHLPASRMGPADHHCHEGQAVICTVKARDKHDHILCLEKVDGACVSIANVGGDLIPLIRAGYRAEDARYEHLRRFHAWASANAERFRFLQLGERVVGEWMAMAHGTIYRALPADPFILFDKFDAQGRRPYSDVIDAAVLAGLCHAPVVSDGVPIPVEKAMGLLGSEGFFGAEDGPEGVVYRVERKGRVDFLAKFVRPSKIDGKFLPEISGHEHWLWPAAVTGGSLP